MDALRRAVELGREATRAEVARGAIPRTVVDPASTLEEVADLGLPDASRAVGTVTEPSRDIARSAEVAIGLATSTDTDSQVNAMSAAATCTGTGTRKPNAEQVEAVRSVLRATIARQVEYAERPPWWVTGEPSERAPEFLRLAAGWQAQLDVFEQWVASGFSGRNRVSMSEFFDASSEPLGYYRKVDDDWLVEQMVSVLSNYVKHQESYRKWEAEQVASPGTTNWRPPTSYDEWLALRRMSGVTPTPAEPPVSYDLAMAYALEVNRIMSAVHGPTLKRLGELPGKKLPGTDFTKIGERAARFVLNRDVRQRVKDARKYRKDGTTGRKKPT